MTSYRLELGSKSACTLEGDWYPLGPWCFVNCEDQFSQWGNEYDFPRIYDNKKAREDDYHLCTQILHDIFPDFIVEYKAKYNIELDLPDAFFIHILRPVLIKTIAMILGRYRYIQKFLVLHKDKKFMVSEPRRFELNTAVDFYIRPEVHPWLNYQLLKYLNPECVTFTVKPNQALIKTETEKLIGDKCKSSLKQTIINYVIDRCVLFRGIYGVTLFQQVTLELLLRIKPLKKSNNTFFQNDCTSKSTEWSLNFDFNDFVKTVCLDYIPKQLSCNLVKNIGQAKDELKKFWWIKGRLLLDKTALHDEDRIVFHALWIHAGGRIAFAQHGSAYEGYKNHYASEFYEFLGDAFFTWGWSNKTGIVKRGKEKLIPVSSFELSCSKNRHSEEGSILVFVGTATSAYFDGILYPEGDDIKKYRKSKVAFLSGLNKNILKLTRYRQHPNRLPTEFEDYNWIIKQGIVIDESKGPLTPIVLKSRLVVVDYYGTIFFQCMAWNVPVIFYFGGEDYNLCSNFLRMLEKLKLIGIFHTSAESARDFVNDNFLDVSEWWNKSDVQKVRQEFCSEFANTSDSCLKEWMKILWRV